MTIQKQSKSSKFLGQLNKCTSPKCNTQMLRSFHKKMYLILIISCNAVSSHKFVNNMRAWPGINNIFRVKQIGNSTFGLVYHL